LIARSGKFGTVNFGSPNDAARISTEKPVEQNVAKVPILAVQTREVYTIPEVLTFTQIVPKQGLSPAGG
jgi:hypothetical protein